MPISRDESNEKAPSIEELEEWMDEGYCLAKGCGCVVEPDGYCGEHGNPSWLIYLGLI